jgi:hypothetical protein
MAGERGPVQKVEGRGQTAGYELQANNPANNRQKLANNRQPSAAISKPSARTRQSAENQPAMLTPDASRPAPRTLQGATSGPPPRLPVATSNRLILQVVWPKLE